MKTGKSPVRWLIGIAAAPLLAGLGAQEAAAACLDDGSGKPQVALVLSGGGALAASQVGAIKVLEENGVPIHCVVGTSMGAVIGALYASGYSADELQRVFVGADWGSVSTGMTPYRELGFRAKDDQREFLSDYVIGIGPEGLELPSGFVSLRGMRRYLRRQIDHVGHTQDFDDLPIPFRAMATDLSNGESVTLASGDLVDAALASMAVPGIYPSQKVDGRVLIDGGMSDQVPIDVARQMGADIIIVIDTTQPPTEFTDSPSVVETVFQTVTLQVWANRQAQIRQLGPQDIHIAPNMKGYSATGFDRLNQGYDVGYAAASAVADRLRAVAAQAAAAPTLPTPGDDQITLSAVTVTESSGVSEKMIRNRVGVHPGKTVKLSKIHDGLDDVAAIGVFDSVDYRLVPTSTGRDLEIATVQRGGNQHVQVGVKLSTTLDGDAYYGLLGRWSYWPINRYAGKINVTGEIGTNIGLDLEWVQPIPPSGRFFMESGLNYTRETLPINVDQVRLAERRDTMTTLRVLFGREFGQWAVASAGVFAANLESELRVGNSVPLGPGAGTYVGLTGRAALDTMNSTTFPTRGLAGDLTVFQFNNTEDDSRATTTTLSFARAGAFAGVGTFLRYEGGFLEEDVPGLPTFTLGGFKRLSGYEDNSVPAKRYHLFRLEAYKRLGADIESTFGVPVFVGATLERADFEFEFEESEFGGWLNAGSIYGAVSTPLGPAYLAFGLGDNGRRALYLYFGRAF